MSWSSDEFVPLASAHELQIAVRKTDGTLRQWTPIWVVGVEGELYVRTWYRRETGWYGTALRTNNARVKAAEVEVDIRVEDVAANDASLRKQIDAAYCQKYGSDASRRMVGDEAAATTLRLVRL